MKRRKKAKPTSELQKTSSFPHFLKLYSTIDKDSLIITDAGHDKIPYELALQFFDFEIILDLWSGYEEEDSNEDFDEDSILSELESKLKYPYRPKSQEELLIIIKKILMICHWLPQEVPVLTAKAIYQEQRWLMLIDVDVDTAWGGDDCFDSYEEKAIQLGNYLKEELGDDTLIVVNDNQHAVKTMNGFSSDAFSFWLYDKEWMKELENETYSVLWAKRNFVREADRLTVTEATRIFPPDALDDYDFDDDDD